jgi:hypothetical protein
MVGVASLLAALAALVATLPVAATPPDRFVLTPQEFVIRGACDFNVLYEDLKVRWTSKSWQRDGSTVIVANGQQRVRLTNQETGSSLVLNYNGPAHFRGGTFSATGHWLHWSQEGDGLWLTTGRLLNFDLSSLRGRRVDLCAKLSAD